jgi:S1-C subfamily serine protease
MSADDRLHDDQPEPVPAWARNTPLVVLSLISLGLLWRYWPFGSGNIHDPSAVPRVVAPRAGLLPEEIANNEVYEKAKKSVVYITTLGVRRDPVSYDLEEVPEGTGSGFIWSEKGYVVTNYHVIQDAAAAEVTLYDGSGHKARLVGVAPDKDLAVLKIDTDGEKLVPIEIGSSHDVKIGQKAYAIGNPFGVGITFTDGMISALDRRMKSATGRTIEGVLQTSAPINPGNSGGPLLDSSGRLIGVTTAIYSPSGASAGIGFAIPVDTVNKVVPELIRRGKVDRPGLGVQIANSQTMRRLGLKTGVLIVDVTPGGAAATSGLQSTRIDNSGRVLRMGDVIIAVGDKPIANADDLQEALSQRQVGDTIKLKVVREREPHEIEVKLDAV